MLHDYHGLYGVKEAKHWMPVLAEMKRRVPIKRPGIVAGRCVLRTEQESRPDNEGNRRSTRRLKGNPPKVTVERRPLSRLNRAASDEERSTGSSGRRLEGLDAPLRAAVQVACSHWLTLNFWLRSSIRQSRLRSRCLKKLTALSLRHRTVPGHGYDVRERTRRLLLGRLWRDNPARYRQLSQRASANALNAQGAKRFRRGGLIITSPSVDG